MNTNAQSSDTEPEEVVETLGGLRLNPYDGLLIGPSFTTPATSGKSWTQLRLLSYQDSSYWRIRHLFEDGWMHPWKMRPQIRHIYEIQLPENLVLGYLNYR
ncbi:hypothetical protein FRC01_011969 [Tulasnella sp. 417]|nr:hypothetical protein FRC01_011969 [Tulasnella sp. 417]